MALHWHRRDLRITDNPALRASQGPTVGLFIFDPNVLEHAGAPRVRFMIAALQSLREEYRSRGGELLCRRGLPTDIVSACAAEVDAQEVTWSRDYSGLARERDQAVAEAISAAGLDFHAEDGAVFHPPGEIVTQDGDPYQVFTYFGRKWLRRPKSAPVSPPTEAELHAPDVVGGEIPPVAELGIEQTSASLPAAGTAAARDRLTAFCDGPIYAYEENRDDPGIAGTSRLSQDLSFGTIGIRTVYEAATDAVTDAPDEDAKESVEAYLRQLAWREFYVQVLWDRPDTVTENYRTYEQPIAWRDDPAGLAAWKAGETGYPIVDAGMRQLKEEAWMHNRVRMIVASFLTKDLQIDWREGYVWFKDRLVDHDTANDVGGWQWAASTGTDAQPYFRVFNPTTQGERYDPTGRYISRYIDELANVPAEAIHQWPDLDEGTRRMHAPEYPDPIVDHAERRESAIAMFEQAKDGE